MVESNSIKQTAGTALLLAAVLAAVATPLYGALDALGSRLERIESRTNQGLDDLDTKLQIEIAATDEVSGERHKVQGDEIIRLRDKEEGQLERIARLEAVLNVLRGEIERLRAEVDGNQ